MLLRTILQALHVFQPCSHFVLLGTILAGESFCVSRLDQLLSWGKVEDSGSCSIQAVIFVWNLLRYMLKIYLRTFSSLLQQDFAVLREQGRSWNG
jgi:hypothetical protein